MTHPASSAQFPVSRRRALPARNIVALACALAAAGLAQAQTPLSQLMVQGTQPAQMALSDDAQLSGSVRVIVQFTEAAVVDARPVTGQRVTAQARAEMQQLSRSLQAAKAPRLAAIRSLGGTVQNTLEYSVNAAVVVIDAGQMAALRRIPGVKLVEPAGVYRMSQSVPTVPQLIGTLPVNQAGNGGQGVVIAVLDSGVDYTHASFDGPGTRAYYLGAVAGAGPTTIGDTPGVYPNGSSRVKGGYDWLGETWNNGTNLIVTPDPDPIDNKQAPADFAGHGTESASAAAGSAVPAGGLQPGSAPLAMILAYRGCSRTSTACEGSALLNSIDSVVKYALGMPNEGQPGANNPAMPAGTRFVLNMSLGANYGNPQTNALSEASRNAVRAGVTVVASAGNSNNIPFIVGTPSATDTVISVAASEPAGLIGGRLQVGAPLNLGFDLSLAAFGALPAGVLAGPLAFAGPNIAAGNFTNLACSAAPNNLPNPGPADPAIPAMPGAIALADRGQCEFSEKAVNAQRAGAAATLIVNNVPGVQTPGAGQAAGLVTTPVLAITQADGLIVKNSLAANPGMTATVAVAQLTNQLAGVNLVDLISGFSSRGPSQAGRAMKPDITAPGTSIWMADVGTGTGGNNNSGTSFSGPLTAGAAVLVLAAKPSLAPWQVKAALMNTAETNVFATKTAGGTTLAALTRMGAGRVQADRAVATGTLAYDAQNIETNGPAYFNTAVAFGPQAFATPGTSSVSRTINVQNLDASPKTYNITSTARFADDLSRGMSFAPSVSSLTVPGNSTGSFQLVATANSAQLPTAGGFPSKLTNLDTCTTAATPPAPVAACTEKFDQLEQDGFVNISAGPNDNVRVPYLMYPRQASSVAVGSRAGTVTLRNAGAAQTVVDVFQLLGGEDAEDQPPLVTSSGVLPVDLRAVGVRYRANAVPTPPAGVTSGDVLDFAVTLWKPMTTLRSAIFNVEIDTNGDGVTDFTVRNLNSTENRSSNFIVTGTTGAPNNAFFFTDFALDSTKAILSVYPSVMGINASSRIGVRVNSSNFNGGPVLDTLPNSNSFQYITLNQPAVTPAQGSLVMASGTAAQVPFTVNGANALPAVSPGNKGLLVLVAENPLQNESTVLQFLR